MCDVAYTCWCARLNEYFVLLVDKPKSYLKSCSFSQPFALKDSMAMVIAEPSMKSTLDRYPMVNVLATVDRIAAKTMAIRNHMMPRVAHFMRIVLFCRPAFLL